MKDTLGDIRSLITPSENDASILDSVYHQRHRQDW